MSKPPMNVLRMRAFPILKQLRLEETLLRTSSENWCIVNDGTDRPTIVMGISGKPTELVEVESVIKDDIPLIRRFSGGGTVIVDDKTIFVTYICNSDAIPGLQAYPRPIMSWTGQLYNEVFRGFHDFQLRENDYAFGNYKFGGNAQSITKHRWVHHTSFLWDYDKKNMEYLKIPTRAPEYRLARHHDEFLCPMKKYLQSRSAFIEKTVNAVGNHFSLKDTHLDAVTSSKTTYSPTTHLLAKQELEAIVTSQSQPRDSRFLSASSN